MLKRKMMVDPELAAEAKNIVALAFRNGPIENVHAGKECPGGAYIAFGAALFRTASLASFAKNLFKSFIVRRPNA
jgi:hypothetical protein